MLPFEYLTSVVQNALYAAASSDVNFAMNTGLSNRPEIEKALAQLHSDDNTQTAGRNWRKLSRWWKVNRSDVFLKERLAGFLITRCFAERDEMLDVMDTWLDGLTYLVTRIEKDHNCRPLPVAKQWAPSQEKKDYSL